MKKTHLVLLFSIVALPPMITAESIWAFSDVSWVVMEIEHTGDGSAWIDVEGDVRNDNEPLITIALPFEGNGREQETRYNEYRSQGPAGHATVRSDLMGLNAYVQIFDGGRTSYKYPNGAVIDPSSDDSKTYLGIFSNGLGNFTANSPDGSGVIVAATYGWGTDYRPVYEFDDVLLAAEASDARLAYNAVHRMQSDQWLLGIISADIGSFGTHSSSISWAGPDGSRACNEAAVPREHCYPWLAFAGPPGSWEFRIDHHAGYELAASAFLLSAAVRLPE